MLVEDPAAILDSPAGRTLAAGLRAAGLIDNTLTAADELLNSLATTPEARAELARSPFALRIEPDGWAIIAALSPAAAERLRDSLDPAPRRRIDARPVFAVRDGRYLLCTVHKPDSQPLSTPSAETHGRHIAERLIIVLAPAAAEPLFERVLRAAAAVPHAAALATALPDLPGPEPFPGSGPVRVAALATTGEAPRWIAASASPTATGWRADLLASLATPMDTVPPSATALIEHTDPLLAVLLPAPPSELPWWPVPTIPGTSPATFAGFWTLRLDPASQPAGTDEPHRCTISFAAALSPQAGPAAADRVMAAMLAPSLPAGRLDDVPAGAAAGPNLAGLLPSVSRCQPLAPRAGPITAVLGDAFQVAWRTHTLPGSSPILLAAAAQDDAVALLAASRPSASSAVLPHQGHHHAAVAVLRARPAALAAQVPLPARLNAAASCIERLRVEFANDGTDDLLRGSLSIDLRDPR